MSFNITEMIFLLLVNYLDKSKEWVNYSNVACNSGDLWREQLKTGETEQRLQMIVIAHR